MHDDVHDTLRATNDDEIIKMNCSTTKSTNFEPETADRPIENRQRAKKQTRNKKNCQENNETETTKQNEK